MKKEKYLKIAKQLLSAQNENRYTEEWRKSFFKWVKLTYGLDLECILNRSQEKAYHVQEPDVLGNWLRSEYNSLAKQESLKNALMLKIKRP